MHFRTNVTSEINSAILMPKCMFKIKLPFNYTGELHSFRVMRQCYRKQLYKPDFVIPVLSYFTTKHTDECTKCLQSLHVDVDKEYTLISTASKH